MKYIIVQLTEDQTEKIEPLMEWVKEAADKGEPGMCVAQVYANHMAVGFLEHETAKLFSDELKRQDYGNYLNRMAEMTL